ncbi:MAG: hypothetical protein GEU95_23385 [Rhizobiales bacterium]|nr:hypothetical protein [Hyphomicrobiales bacterium]
MANSIFLARLIGPVLIAGAVGMLVNNQVYRMLVDEFLRSRALIYISGILAMTAGLAIVLTHNVWVANWPVLITIFGWLGLIGGAVRMIAPQGTEKIGRRILRYKMGLTIGGAAWLAFGAILCFFGYVR